LEDDIETLNGKSKKKRRKLEAIYSDGFDEDDEVL
jgi:hypothetical protein